MLHTLISRIVFTILVITRICYTSAVYIAFVIMDNMANVTHYYDMHGIMHNYSQYINQVKRVNWKMYQSYN